MKIVAQNKKALFDYEILSRVEAGLVLTGDEVKSIRAGHVSMVGSFATVKQSELFLINCTISPYSKAYIKREDQAQRSRKLLLKRRELNKMMSDIAKKGVTIVPLKIYFNERNIAKVELGIAKHKKAADKREVIKERDEQRQARRAMKGDY
jgi:SsrA-binding protein